MNEFIALVLLLAPGILATKIYREVKITTVDFSRIKKKQGRTVYETLFNIICIGVIVNSIIVLLLHFFHIIKDASSLKVIIRNFDSTTFLWIYMGALLAIISIGTPMFLRIPKLDEIYLKVINKLAGKRNETIFYGSMDLDVWGALILKDKDLKEKHKVVGIYKAGELTTCGRIVGFDSGEDFIHSGFKLINVSEVEKSINEGEMKDVLSSYYHVETDTTVKFYNVENTGLLEIFNKD